MGASGGSSDPSLCYSLSRIWSTCWEERDAVRVWLGVRSEKGKKKKKKKRNEGFGKMRFRSAIPRHPRIEHIPVTSTRLRSDSSRYIYFGLILFTFPFIFFNVICFILLPFLNILLTTRFPFSFSFTSPRGNK